MRFTSVPDPSGAALSRPHLQSCCKEEGQECQQYHRLLAIGFDSHHALAGTDEHLLWRTYLSAPVPASSECGHHCRSHTRLQTCSKAAGNRPPVPGPTGPKSSGADPSKPVSTTSSKNADLPATSNPALGEKVVEVKIYNPSGTTSTESKPALLLPHSSTHLAYHCPKTSAKSVTLHPVMSVDRQAQPRASNTQVNRLLRDGENGMFLACHKFLYVQSAQ